MNDYPREDQEIEICLADNSRVSGMVNIAGRSISAYLHSSDLDIVIYGGLFDNGQKAGTLLVSKRQTIWVKPDLSVEKSKYGNWKKIRFRLFTGQSVEGVIDITGYDRISDYLQDYTERYYEVYDCRCGNEASDLMFISRKYSLWKEPC